MKKLVLTLVAVCLLTVTSSITLPKVKAQSVPECYPCDAQQNAWVNDLWSLADEGYITDWTLFVSVIQVIATGQMPQILWDFYAADDSCWADGEAVC